MLRHSLSLICVVAAVVAGMAAPARAAECTAPRVLVVLDKSSSMLDTVAGLSKWEIAQKALTTVLTNNDAKLELGLMIFPSPNKCGAGEVKVDIGPLHASAILGSLGAAPEKSGFYTPMAQSLEAAANVPGLNDNAYSNHVLLVTDGWQYCGDNDPASHRFWPATAVKQLKQLGITTHVVGFGASVDALTLNKMAAEAGTKVSNTCDENGADPVGTNNCYYQANDLAQLQNALATIAQQIQAEQCDGKDNNCNGVIDDGLTTPACDKQLGVCAGAVKVCGGAAGWRCAEAEYRAYAQAQGRTYEGDETSCDGKDNDCDGTVDEGCGCTVGQTRPCTSTCGPGQQSCSATGNWQACNAPIPSAEICDGKDNDCDGVADSPTPLCDNGGVCVDAVCQPVGSSGCDCQLNGETPTAALLAPVLLLALAFVRRRRRASRR